MKKKIEVTIEKEVDVIENINDFEYDEIYKNDCNRNLYTLEYKNNEIALLKVMYYYSNGHGYISIGNNELNCDSNYYKTNKDEVLADVI